MLTAGSQPHVVVQIACRCALCFAERSCMCGPVQATLRFLEPFHCQHYLLISAWWPMYMRRQLVHGGPGARAARGCAKHARTSGAKAEDGARLPAIYLSDA